MRPMASPKAKAVAPGNPFTGQIFRAIRQTAPGRDSIVYDNRAGLGGEKPVRSKIIEEINIFPYAEELKGKTGFHIRESGLKKEKLTSLPAV